MVLNFTGKSISFLHSTILHHKVKILIFPPQVTIMVKKRKSIHSWISAHWRHTDSKLRTILLDLIGLYTKRVYCKTNIPSIIMLSLPKIPFAASHSRGTKPSCWRAKVALGQDKQKTYIIWNGNFLCLSCPSATFALQHSGFVPCEWLAAKGLFLHILNQATCHSYFTSTLPVLLRIKPFLNATDLHPTALFGRQVKQFMQGYPRTLAIQYFCNNASVYKAVILSIRVFIYWIMDSGAWDIELNG